MPCQLVNLSVFSEPDCPLPFRIEKQFQIANQKGYPKHMFCRYVFFGLIVLIHDLAVEHELTDHYTIPYVLLLLLL